MLTKAEATAMGKALLKRMKGKGWKLRVWENMGWHYSVHAGTLCVHPSYDKTFHCLLGPEGSGMGLWHSISPSNHDHDPNKAVAKQIANAKKVMDWYNQIILDAEKVIAE